MWDLQLVKYNKQVNDFAPLMVIALVDICAKFDKKCP